LLSLKLERFKVSPYFLVPLETMSMIAMAGAFAATLSLAIKLAPLCAGLDTSASTDLMAYDTVCPISLSSSIAGGVGW
jgi:hypothetical protein